MSKIKRYIADLRKATTQEEISDLCFDFVLHCYKLEQRGYDREQLDKRREEFYTIVQGKDFNGFDWV